MGNSGGKEYENESGTAMAMSDRGSCNGGCNNTTTFPASPLSRGGAAAKGLELKDNRIILHYKRIAT